MERDGMWDVGCGMTKKRLRKRNEIGYMEIEKKRKRRRHEITTNRKNEKEMKRNGVKQNDDGVK